MVTKRFKIDGRTGHRMKTSFSNSFTYDFSKEDKKRIIEVKCSDQTGTNDYVIVIITCNTEEECDRELEGQLSDGIFEDCRYGTVWEEVCWLKDYWSICGFGDVAEANYYFDTNGQSLEDIKDELNQREQSQRFYLDYAWSIM